MRNYIFLILFLIPVFSLAQSYKESILYNEKGQLKADTALTINQSQSVLWKGAENNIFSYMVLGLEYPVLAKESGIKGLIIASFEYVFDTISNIKLLNRIGGGLDEIVINVISSKKEKIAYELKIQQRFQKGKSEFYGTYYIPFDFTLLDIRDFIKKNNSVPIIGIKTPLISRFFE